MNRPRHLPSLQRLAFNLALLCNFSIFALAANLTNSEAFTQGHALAEELVGRRPAEEAQIYGTLKIRNSTGKSIEVPIRYNVKLDPNGWSDIYETQPVGELPGQRLTVRHVEGKPNQYTVESSKTNTQSPARQTYAIPFANSDFWITDLGLEFLHWPDQRLIKKEMRRGRACAVLESINPTPGPGGYSRVLSWADNETGGLVRAEAYDSNNNLLKEFSPRHFKKVENHWQIKEIEIRNDQTDSRSHLEFNYETH
jgi:hypothetical protein